MSGEWVKGYVGQYKYEGALISEDALTYEILDIKVGRVKLPKAETVLKFVGVEK